MSEPHHAAFHDDYDLGAALGVAVGYVVTPRVAVELEYAWRSARADVGARGSATTLGPEPDSYYGFGRTVSARAGMVEPALPVRSGGAGAC